MPHCNFTSTMFSGQETNSLQRGRHRQNSWREEGVLQEKKVLICFFSLTASQKLTHLKLTSLLANMATDTRLPAMPKLPMRRVAANVMWENRVKIAILVSWCDNN